MFNLNEFYSWLKKGLNEKWKSKAFISSCPNPALVPSQSSSLYSPLTFHFTYLPLSPLRWYKHASTLLQHQCAVDWIYREPSRARAGRREKKNTLFHPALHFNKLFPNGRAVGWGKRGGEAVMHVRKALEGLGLRYEAGNAEAKGEARSRENVGKSFGNMEARVFCG